MATSTAEPKQHVIHTRVPDHLAHEVKARALREDRTMSNLIRVALNQYLASQSQGQHQ